MQTVVAVLSIMLALLFLVCAFIDMAMNGSRYALFAPYGFGGAAFFGVVYWFLTP